MLTEIFDYPSLYDPYDWPICPQTLGSRQVTPPSEGHARITECQGLALFHSLALFRKTGGQYFLASAIPDQRTE
jgi:hypothetical protein